MIDGEKAAKLTTFVFVNNTAETMQQRKSIFEVRYRTLLGAIVSSLVMAALYIASMVVVDYSGSMVVAPSPLGGCLTRWGVEHPVMAYMLLSVGMLYITINVAQVASRLRIYGVSTHLPMEMYPMMMLAVGVRGDMTVGVVLMLMLLSAMKNMFSSYRATNSSGVLSIAALTLGAMPLFYPPAIVLWIVVPPTLIIFERTLREVIVALVILMVPLFSYLYILWMQGGDFAVEASRFWSYVVDCGGVCIWSSVSIVEVVVYVLVGLVMLLSSVAMFQLDNTVKARRRLVMSSLLAFACIVMALLPSSSGLSLWLLALPLALLAPIVFIRLGRVVSFWVYVVLFIVGLVNAFWGNSALL